MSEDKTKRKSDCLIYILSRRSVITITVYFVILLFAGISFSIYVILNLDFSTNSNVLIYTIISSLSVCAMLNSIQYIRRIYKACLDCRIIKPQGNDMVQFGNILYFILRPLYAFAFVIIVVFILLSGIMIVSDKTDFELNYRFLYMCVIFSSIIGYSIGDVLDKFEKYSENRIQDFFEKGGSYEKGEPFDQGRQN